MLFTKEKLRKLIIPIIIEQILAFTVGMADMVMVAQAGEAAVSGVSLIDSIGNLVICLFSALATGGAVVSAQYLGKKEKENAGMAANQLILCVTVISTLIAAFCIVFYKQVIQVIYGTIDADIRRNAEQYFYFIALSFPFLAIYNGSAALFRSMGNSKICMWISILMNVQNVIGNAVFIFGFHSGARGVGISTMLSRVTGAVLITMLLRNQKLPFHIDRYFRFGIHLSMIQKILYIGIPTGLENSMFQIGKLVLASLVSSFGRIETSANAVANGITNFGIIPGNAMGLALITVVGQCIGAGDSRQAYENTKKLMKISYIAMIALNLVMALLSTPLIHLYNLSPEVNAVAQRIILAHCLACCLIWVPSFVIPHALRASNDVRFTMVISIFSMWTFRICFGFILGKYVGLKALGVWIAMFIDWTFRGMVFVWRFKRKKLKVRKNKLKPQKKS